MAAPIPVYDPDPIDLTPVQRQITLRNVKGSALTYAEMDKNLSSFFYSASLSGTDLLLHYLYRRESYRLQYCICHYLQ